MEPSDICVVNGGHGAWAFANLAAQIADGLWLEIDENPRRYNYFLATDANLKGESFIPVPGCLNAADKRKLATLFAKGGVPTPRTLLVDSLSEIKNSLIAHPEMEWCIKYPTGCGAGGHRMVNSELTLPKDWPTPLVLQEFIRMDRPEVYRIYGAGRTMFGWIVRRFPAGVAKSPWVAHARGARYELTGPAPDEAVAVGRAALEVVDLFDSFGCVDLVQRPSGEWVVLEVGTDGFFNHVDRDLGVPALEDEILQRIAEAFWRRIDWRPWGTGPWCRRSDVAVARPIRESHRD